MNEDDDESRMGLQTELIDRAAVARLLGITLKKLYRCMRRLQASPVNPFPRPVLGRGRGARWNRDDIWRWIARGGEHAPVDAPGDPPVWALRLDERTQRLPRRRGRRTES